MLRCLQAKLKSLAGHHKHAEFKIILGQLGSGTHPSADDLIAVKDIFAEGPYSLLGMSRKHVVCTITQRINSTLSLHHNLFPCRNVFSTCTAFRTAFSSGIVCTSTHFWCTIWTIALRVKAVCIIWAVRHCASHAIYADLILKTWAKKTWSNGYANG